MWVIMPESPCKSFLWNVWIGRLGGYSYLLSGYCARSGLHDKGRKVLRYINGGVKGYDVDYECESYCTSTVKIGS